MSNKGWRTCLIEKFKKWDENRKRGVYEVIGIVISDLEEYELLEKVDQIYLEYHNSTFEEIMNKTYGNSLLVKGILESCSDANLTFMKLKNIIERSEECKLGISKFHEAFNYLFIDTKSLTKLIIKFIISFIWQVLNLKFK